MDFLLPLAAKSLLIAGITLLALKAMQRRSAADRSWIAHLGLGSIAVLPVALLLLPQLQVATPWIAAEPAVQPTAAVAPVIETEVATSTATFPAAAEAGPAETAIAGSIDWSLLAYAAPAGLLLLLTLVALLRLVLLKSKANVLVEPHWLTALARAQRRMGFKHGTALLTSDDLRSPISWGLMRPVILLNSAAAEAHGEAEAIIAHELAHVARLDWVKLLLSRVTVALFWFNPLVWVLAREAHQLREEAADDAVLGSEIEDTDYARLLVGIARHECRGLLIGAHGVAPGRTSLARRVQRVLDVASQRAPGSWRWTAAAAFFALGMAVPLATLHLVPMTPAAAHVDSVGGKGANYAASATGADRDSTRSAEGGDGLVSATAAALASAIRVSSEVMPQDLPESVMLTQPNGASVTRIDGRTVLRQPSGASISSGGGRTVLTQPSGATITSDSHGRTVLTQPSGATITIAAPDSNGRRRTVMRGANGSTVAYADASAVPGLAAVTAHPHPPRAPRQTRGPGDAIDRAIERKALGASPEYVRSIRAAAPHLRLDHDDVIQLKALGVSPAYLRDLASVGYPRLSADDIVEAKALGITGTYARSIASAGYGPVSIDRLVELKAVGVTAADVSRFRRASGRLPSLGRLVEMKALGVTPEDLEEADSP